MGLFLLLLLVIVLVLFIPAAMSLRRRHQKQAMVKIEKARQHYQIVLKHHAADPTNLELKQRTLAYGRQYANFTRQSNTIPTFDESALMNDINVITSSTSASAPPIKSTF